MKKEEFIAALKGVTIAEVILDNTETAPFNIATLMTTDGYQIDFATGEVSHPAYEKDNAAFFEKLDKASPASHFTFRTSLLSLEDMRQAAATHAKKINANGGNAIPDITMGNIKFLLVKTWPP